MKKNRFDDRKLFITLQKNSIDEIISFLEPFGIDSYDRDGRTMLMNLIIEGKEELLKDFMEFNPNVNSQDFNGYSALHFAVQEKFTAAIDLLLDKEELQVDLQDKWGNTPLLRLVWEENIDNMCIDNSIQAKHRIQHENQRNKNQSLAADRKNQRRKRFSHSLDRIDAEE